MSRVIGMARPVRLAGGPRLRGVETSSCHHRRPGRRVAVRGRPHLRCLPGLDQSAHGPLPGRGRGRLRAPLTRTQVQPRRDRRGDRPTRRRATQEARRARSGRRRGHHRLAPPAPSRHGAVAGHDQPDPGPPRHGHPDPAKRPKSSYIRFEAEQPNETWQSDFTHYRLTRPDRTRGIDVEIISWLDDHSRYAPHISAHARVTAPIVLATFRAAADLHGHPASTLTDIQSGCAAIRADPSAGGEDRCRPAPARHRCLTEWSAQRLLAC